MQQHQQSRRRVAFEAVIAPMGEVAMEIPARRPRCGRGEASSFIRWLITQSSVSSAELTRGQNSFVTSLHKEERRGVEEFLLANGREGLVKSGNFSGLRQAMRRDNAVALKAAEA